MLGDSAALQQRGQKLYGQGHYDKAAEAFSEVVYPIREVICDLFLTHLQALREKDVSDCIGILDNRAAAYNKLAQNDLALQDARKMIKRDKLDARVSPRSE